MRTLTDIADIIREARAEQDKQEPAAIVVAAEYEDGSFAGNRLEWKGNNEANDFPQGTAFYTTPPSVAEWEKLRDPVALHQNLLRGFPARLTPDMLKHLLGNEFDKSVEAAIEATKEKATKVCDDLYKYDRKESGYDEGWNDALGTAEQAIRSMK